MKHVIYVFLAALLVIAGCSERDLPTPNDTASDYVIELFNVPNAVNPDSSYTIMVKVSPSESIENVELTVTKQGASGTLLSANLYDDGAAVHAEDGDQVAYDGVFSQNITWESVSDQIEILVFSFKAIRGTETVSGPVTANVQNVPNIVPIITSYVVPDSILSGSNKQYYFQATVTDENGIEDIKTVEYTGYQNEINVFEGELAASGTAGEFVLNIDSTFAVGKKGEYQFVMHAVDLSGAKSDAVTKTLYIENKRPELGEISAINSVVRPGEGYVVNFLIQIPIIDMQGLGDIKEVRVSWQKPNGEYGGGSPYEMFDNGLEYDYNQWDQGYRGDLTANDGIYSLTGVFDPDDLLGNYILIFWAEDLAGNKSDEMAHIITLLEAE